jgi:hypothetical protein
MTLSRGRVAQLLGANVAGLEEEVAEREREREKERSFIDNHEVTESDGGELNPKARGDRVTPSRGSVVQLLCCFFVWRPPSRIDMYNNDVGKKSAINL